MEVLRVPVMAVTINYKNDSASLQAAYSDGASINWADEKYRTLVFDESPTGDFLVWLEKFAVKQS